jgi:hypothetical protein
VRKRDSVNRLANWNSPRYNTERFTDFNRYIALNEGFERI